MSKRKRTKPLIPPMKYMEDIMKGIKRKPKDPLAALRKKYPGKWQVYPGHAYKYVVRCTCVQTAHLSGVIAVTDHLPLARAIARMGAK
jgi:hypothetical protein